MFRCHYAAEGRIITGDAIFIMILRRHYNNTKKSLKTLNILKVYNKFEPGRNNGVQAQMRPSAAIMATLIN